MSGDEQDKEEREPARGPVENTGGSGEDSTGIGPFRAGRMQRKTLLDNLRHCEFGLKAEAIEAAMIRQQKVAAGLDPDQQEGKPPRVISDRERRLSLEALMKAIDMLWDMEKTDKGAALIERLRQIGVLLPSQAAAMDASVVAPERAAQIAAERMVGHGGVSSGGGNGHADGNGKVK